ncbi:hypothetical protein MSIMFB_04857 [Mycobacterium simulans]|uniref:HTTM domain-containing protein n=1 Tax=Mycobacterium simulans TaxID=627089 RepID=A0A7Z7IRT7_9MYCO|nr:hypothetical protein [Mycobacterium simulans]SOJ57378.1 hypothetical protein MSIMFB_04857 [Mycobacterium simulans]
MGIWWINAVTTAFDMRVPALPSNLFRIGIALATLLKFTSEQMSGAWRYLDEGSYVRFRYLDAHPRGPFRSVTFYRVAYLAKWLAATGLFLGIAPQMCALVLVFWFSLEISFDWKYHTIFLLLACAVLSVDWGSASILRLDRMPCLLDTGCRTELVNGATTWVWPKWITLLIVAQMYWASAYTKLRSAQFRSGSVLVKLSRYLYINRPLLRHWEFHYPNMMVNYLIEAPVDVCRRRWALATWATIAGEALLPIGLATPVPPIYYAAFGFGAMMHTGFTVLLPRRLIPFSIACLAAYLMIIPIRG